MTQKKLRIGLVFGGRSGEHEVSLASAKSVMEKLNPDKYEVVPIGITKAGTWLLGTTPDKLIAAGQQGVQQTSQDAQELTSVTLTSDPTVGRLIPLQGD